VSNRLRRGARRGVRWGRLDAYGRFPPICDIWRGPDGNRLSRISCPLPSRRLVRALCARRCGGVPTWRRRQASRAQARQNLRRIDDRLGKRPQTRPARCVSRAITRPPSPTATRKGKAVSHPPGLLGENRAGRQRSREIAVVTGTQVLHASIEVILPDRGVRLTGLGGDGEAAAILVARLPCEPENDGHSLGVQGMRFHTH
jgi:hypothetical protein